MPEFYKAAERMYLSQPGLSRQIAAMEREIGIELFERGKNPVKLTAAGAICGEYLEWIRGEYQKMLNEATMAQRIEHDSLNIGGIEGQLVGQCYENACCTSGAHTRT
jgi:DNA-binding transcriptional LysR family regulator